MLDGDYITGLEAFGTIRGFPADGRHWDKRFVSAVGSWLLGHQGEEGLGLTRLRPADFHAILPDGSD
jgi:hypothetical protein